MKVIFLDIDGVMKPVRSYWLGHKPNGGWCPLSVAAVNKIHERTSAVVVFNTAWNTMGLEELNEIAITQGLEAPVIGMTGYPKYYKRLEAVYNWLEDNPEVEQWCCLDDKVLDDPNCRLIDPDIGISPNDYRAVTELLGNRDPFVVLL